MSAAGAPSLFDLIRARCPADAWSEGVGLARRGAVVVESSADDEIVVRLELSGLAVAPQVTLYPEDGEWDCDCESPLEACAHAAAAVVALRRGQQRTDHDSAARRIEYRLRRSPEGVALERGVAEGDRFHVLEAPLEDTAAGRFTGPAFAASAEDLDVERALRGKRRGVVDRASAARVLAALARVEPERLTLDGEPIRTSAAPSLPVAAVTDDRDRRGFVVRLVEAAEVDERFRNGIVRVGETLRPEGEPELSGRERHELSAGRRFREDEVGALVGEVIPSLAKRLAVEVRTSRLPGAMAAEPRMDVVARRDGERLYLLPRVVYGDPPLARVERHGEGEERLVSLGGPVPVRDREAERRLADRFSRELGLAVGEGVELDAETAVSLAPKLASWKGAVPDDVLAAFRRHEPLSPRVALEPDRFDVRFATPSGRGADPGAVLGAYREGRSLVPLSGGGFAPLPADWLDEHGDLVADLLAAKEASQGMGLPRAMLPALARLAADLDQPPPLELDALRRAAGDLADPPEAPLAGSLRSTLRDYQRQGVDWLVALRRAGLGGLLADDMGLGKTVQALAALEGRTLVAAPTSVLRSWAKEAARFRPDLRVCVYHGPDRKLDPQADLVVTSHALLRLDRDALAAIEWSNVVIDESQAIKNPESQLARAAYALRAPFRVSLTGTPVENRLTDLWSQMHFLHPGFLGGRSDFEERYVRPVERGDERALARLRERIRPFFLRRLKSEVAPELPPRTEVTLHCELDDDERAVYESVRLAARRDVLARLEKKGGGLAALEVLLRLRQAACHPALVPGVEPPESSTKTELLLEALETAAAEDHRSLVFSQWTSMLDLVEPHLEARGLPFVRLDGSTRDRDAVVAAFQAADGPPVFLVSLKAGGTGLTLTAADHVFLVDPWWNPAVEEQAFDRAHRIGQDKPVFVHRLVAADTVEERILALQEEKRALAEVAPATGAVPTLTRDDVLRLLE